MISLYPTAGFVFAMAVISCMWCVVGLCVLMISVSCDESCPTWLHPSKHGECVCDPFQNVVVCKNECKNEAHVSILDFYCLTSNGDGSNTSVVGRCLPTPNHGKRLLSGVGLLVAISTTREDCVASVKATIPYQPVLMI